MKGDQGDVCCLLSVASVRFIGAWSEMAMVPMVDYVIILLFFVLSGK